MESSESSHRSSRRGLGDSLIDTLVGFGDYVQARLNLFQFEAKEAGSDLFVRLTCFVVAAVFCCLSYVITLAGVIAWVSVRWDLTWYFVALAAAAIHLIAALILVVIGKRKFGRRPFRDSIDELKRDQEWLEELRSRK